MGLFDSGMINFIKMLIIIGLISMLYMVVMQKIKEQNHKITSLLSLVSTMATEITNLKNHEPVSPEPVYEKVDISNDSDSEVSYSDSESEDENEIIKSENIDFFETDSEIKIEEVLECENIEDLNVESVPESVVIQEHDYKKMTVTKLLEVAIEKGLTNKEKGSKMKKKDLLELF
jgi:hypothetical protein